MVGSPNYTFGVYDGDDSAAEGSVPARPGRRQIEDVFEAYFAARGEPTKAADFSGRSDYGPFIAVGIPAGGLFTGAEDHQDRSGCRAVGWRRGRAEGRRATTTRATA